MPSLIVTELRAQSAFLRPESVVAGLVRVRAFPRVPEVLPLRLRVFALRSGQKPKANQKHRRCNTEPLYRTGAEDDGSVKEHKGKERVNADDNRSRSS